jgi:hypothetical protein
MRSISTSLLAIGLALAGCNNPTTPADTGNTGGNDGGHDAATTPTDDAGSDAGSDSGAVIADTGADAPSTPDAGCSGVLLTIRDDFSWCDITVNGGAAFGGASETICVPANSNVALAETAHGGFMLGHWYGTTGDTGSGETGTVSGATSTAHIMTGAAGTSSCVSTCCPTIGASDCPTANTCP